MNMADILQAVRALSSRIATLINAGTVTAVDDSKEFQTIDAKYFDSRTGLLVKHIQSYGFSSHAHVGAQALSVHLNGQPDQGLVLQVADRRYRLKNLAPGEVALYDDLGQIVKLSRTKIQISSPYEIEVTAPKVVVESPDVHLGDEGGAQVARVGDTVANGVITSGSSKVRCVA